MTTVTVTEIKRHDSINGYAYEYDDTLNRVKEGQRIQQERVNWWQERAESRHAEAFNREPMSTLVVAQAA
jgi:hypothetical protein